MSAGKEYRVRIWKGRTPAGEDYQGEPDEIVTVEEETPAVWQDDPHYHSGGIGIDIHPEDAPATLGVYTSDSVHSPPGYDDHVEMDYWDGPVEQGLTWPGNHDYPPFGCEVWGRVMFFVEADYDDHVWWSARPERSDVTSVTTEEDFPKMTISPFTEVPDRTEKRTDPGNENNEIQQFCVEPGCGWTDYWDGGSAANDPAIDHLQENPDHTVSSGVAEFYTEFYELQRDGDLDVTREMVEEEREAQEGSGDD